MRKNMSEAQKKYSKTSRGKTHLNTIAELAKDKFRKPFKVYLGDKEVGEWTLLRECARDLKLDHSAISKCLKDKMNTHKGYKFKYI